MLNLRSLINQIQLNPQINEYIQKYKNMKAKSKIVKKILTTENRTVVSTYLGQTMLRFQHKACIMGPYNFK
jgi:cell division protein FtsX